MGSLSGKKLTALGGALLAIAAVAAVRLAVSGDLRRPPVVNEAGSVATRLSIEEHLAGALAAEKRGDIATALSHYRAAASLDPLCVDRNSTRFLGPRFEEKFRRWASDLRGGRMKASPAVLRDASYLFRRMYGGCG